MNLTMSMVELSQRIDEWNACDTITLDNALDLFGCNSMSDLYDLAKRRPDITSRIEMLLGDHGYTFYKMLKARNEIKRIP